MANVHFPPKLARDIFPVLQIRVFSSSQTRLRPWTALTPIPSDPCLRQTSRFLSSLPAQELLATLA